VNPQLEKLIDAVIADGDVTDKEREVLHRKAREFGIDADEVDIHLDSRLHEKGAAAKPTKAMKCPQCGAPIAGLARVCADCGHVLEDGGPGKAPDLHATLARLEELLVELKSIPVKGTEAYRREEQARLVGGLGKLAGVGSSSVPDQAPEIRFEAAAAKVEKERRVIGTYFGSDPQVKKVLVEVDAEIAKRRDSAAAAEKQQGRQIKRAGVVAGGVWVLMIAGVVVGLARMDSPEEKIEKARAACREPNEFTMTPGKSNATDARSWACVSKDQAAAWRERAKAAPPAASAAQQAATATAPFDRDAAKKALGAVDYKACGSGGDGSVSVTFGPDGTVSAAKVTDGDYGGGVKLCLSRVFGEAKVPAFVGVPETLKWRVKL
jgi:hypothetical protein